MSLLVNKPLEKGSKKRVTGGKTKENIDSNLFDQEMKAIFQDLDSSTANKANKKQRNLVAG